VFYSQKPSFDAEQKNVKRFLKAVTYTDDRPHGMAENTILQFWAYFMVFSTILTKMQTKIMEIINVNVSSLTVTYKDKSGTLFSSNLVRF
jgi:hypothetical protein